MNNQFEIDKSLKILLCFSVGYAPHHKQEIEKILDNINLKENT